MSGAGLTFAPGRTERDAPNTWDIKALFGAPGYKIENNVPGRSGDIGATQYANNLLEGLTNVGENVPPPLDTSKTKILSGMEQYEICIGQNDLPGQGQRALYPYTDGDYAIETANERYLFELAARSVYVGLGVGSGNKDILFLNNLIHAAEQKVDASAEGNWKLRFQEIRKLLPAVVVLNDYFVENIKATKSGIQNTCLLNQSKNKKLTPFPIWPAPGDFFMLEPWNDANKAMKQEKLKIADEFGNAKIVVQVRSPTMNDGYNPVEMAKLFNFIFPPEGRDFFDTTTTTFLAPFDSTDDEETLRKAYNNPRAKQFVLTGFAFWCKKNQIPFKPEHGKVDLEITKSDDGCTDVRHLVWEPGGIESKSTPIRKTPYNTLMGMFYNYNISVVEHPMHANVDGFPKLNYNWYPLRAQVSQEFSHRFKDHSPKF